MKNVITKSSIINDAPAGLIIGCVVLLFVVLGGVIVSRRSHHEDRNRDYPTPTILVALPSSLIHESIVNNGMSESTHREI